MAKLIITLLAGIAAAIPTIYAWRLRIEHKTAKKRHEKRLDDIRRAVAGGDIAAIKRELSKWL